MDKSFKIISIIIAIGIWVIAMQNAGIIPTKQNVYVKGGYINVSGSVDVDNIVDVNIGDEVDVNISAINGHSDAFYDHSTKHKGKYYRIPVYTGQ